MPVVAVVFICGLSDVLINEYLFIYLFILCMYVHVCMCVCMGKFMPNRSYSLSSDECTSVGRTEEMCL